MRNYIINLVCTLIFCYNIGESLATSMLAEQIHGGEQENIIIYRDSLLYTYISKPCVIFLAPSSTGKTTLISKIKDSDNWNNFVFSGSDQITHEIGNNFKSYSDMIQTVLKYIKDELIKNSLLKNRGLIIDTITADLFIKAIWLSFIKNPVYVFALYLSPEVLAKRIVTRNLDCIDVPEKNFRTFVPFNQYVEIFEKTSQNTALKMNKCEVYRANIFDDILNLAKQTPFEMRNRYIKSVQQNTKFQMHYLNQMLSFFKNKNESIYLKPRIPFAFAVDMSAHPNLVAEITNWLQYLE